MRTDRGRINLGKVYFLYLFLVLLPQIVGYSAKGSMMDTVWKAGVIAITMLYVAYKVGWRIARYVIVPCLLYIFGQGLALMFGSIFTTAAIVNCVVVIAMVYLFLSVSHQNEFFDMNDMMWFVNAFILLMLYAIIYNFIKDPSAVLNAMSNKSAYSNMMSSFFDNKQTFGMFLFMAFIVAGYGYIISEKKKYLLIAILFFANLFLCLSRTALFACAAFILISTVLLYSSNRNLSRFIVLMIIAALLLVKFVPALNTFIFDVVLDTESTMDARSNIWEDAFRALQGEKWIFGFGEGSVGKVLESVDSDGRNAHNGIVQVLITGGIVKLILYVCVLCKVVASIMRIKKYNKQLAYVFLAALISIFVFSMGEALVLLDTSAPCIVSSIICIALPVCVDGYYQNLSIGKNARNE